MKKIIFLFIILNSCIAQNTSLPDWYVTPINNDKNKLYGVGYGANLDDATKFALNNLAERLKIEVSASFSIDKQEASVNNNAEFSYDVRQQVKTKIDEFEFNNYFVEKTAEYDNQIYVLLSIDRASLRSRYNSKINKAQDEIAIILNSLNKKSVIQKLSLYNELTQPIIANQARINLIRTITQNESEFEDLAQLYLKIKADELENRDSLVIKVAAKPSDQRIADVIAESLNKLKIVTVSNNADTLNNDRVAILKISSETIHQKIYGNFVVKIIVQLKLVENFGKQISANKIEFSASSSLSSNEAVNAALVKLKKYIAKQHIYKILGL